MYDVLFLGYFVRLITLIPLHPLCPHLYNFVFLELSSDAESSNCIDVRIKVPTMLEVSIFLIILSAFGLPPPELVRCC